MHSPLGCRRLGAERFASIPFLLPMPDSREPIRDRPSVVSDELFRAFLVEAADSSVLAGAGAAIPLRWRRMNPEIRRAWFVKALDGFLRIDHQSP